MNRSTIFGFVAVLLWSTTVALARSISEQVGPFTAGAAVYLTGGSLLLGKLYFKERFVGELRKVSRAYLFGCGTLFLIYTLALFLALGMAENRQQSLEVGLINYLWPSLTILFSLFILSKRASVWLIPATLVAFLGIIIVITKGASISMSSFLMNVLSNPIAYALALIAAISWALYSNLTRLWSDSSDVGAVPLFVMLTGLVFLFVRFLRPEEGVWSTYVLAEVALLGLSTALAYVFWDIAMRKGDVVLVVSFSYLTPFLSTLVGSIYLRVMPDISLWLGCLFIIVGSFSSWRSIIKKRVEST